jgi:uncharacterized protein (TIRG00374 family)
VRKRWPALLAGLALSLLLPILAFQGVNLRQSWAIIVGCRVPQLFLAICFFLGTLAFRSWRWRCLLAAQQPVSFRSCVSATCVGFLANNILPFKLGDLVRVGVLRQLEGANGARVLGTLVVERVLDVLSLVGVLAAYLAFAGGGEHRIELLTAGCLALAGGAVLLVLLLGSYRWRRGLQHLIARPFGCVSAALAAKVEELSGGVFDGLQVFASPRQVLQVVLLSAALWGASMAEYYWVGQSLGLAVPPQRFSVVLFTAAFGAIIPAAPGAVGTFHSFARLGLYLVGVSSGEEALAFAAVLHAEEWMLLNLCGFCFLIRDRVALLMPQPA